MIDRATVQKIIDAADIVDVVSDFVTLKKRGANYVGLCPFHNDRRPSFYVSRAKGLCKCFSCGEGGSAVNFIMKHEQMTYPEALRYLANKYHIEIQERELTDEERYEQTERESMLIINEFAMQFFEDQLHNTTEGQEIGLSYFNERSFNAESIKKFHLGYSPENKNAFYSAAIKAGYNRELLFKIGLCIDDHHNGGFDRFHGRVMFPIFNVAGKVIAFGGRTLKKSEPAKYLNSPESLVYSKKNTLYGLFQAKREISKKDKCFIVEGYADVISMHQSGFENVIASSGTALTEGHIHIIHRFTENVTELFDGDAAGIHAALRGVDMLLQQGLNIKVLLLPEPEDPDSFARSHSASEIQQYIDDHEADFIKFKTDILLKDTANDPIKRSKAITDIVQSISVIPNEITRSIYAKECSIRFGLSESVIINEIGKRIAKNREENFKRKEREKAQLEREEGFNAEQLIESEVPLQDVTAKITAPQQAKVPIAIDKVLYPCEKEVIRYIAKYGMCFLCITHYEDGDRPTTVSEFIYNEISSDNIGFSNSTFAKIYNIAVDLIPQFYQDFAKFSSDLEIKIAQLRKDGSERILSEGIDSNDTIKAKESALEKEIETQQNQEIEIFRKAYLEKILCSDQDDDIRKVSLDLVSEKYQLSKIHTEFTNVAQESDRLTVLIPEALYNWKNALVTKQIKELQQHLETADSVQMSEIMGQLQELYQMRKELAKLTGERVINPLY